MRRYEISVTFIEKVTRKSARASAYFMIVPNTYETFFTNNLEENQFLANSTVDQKVTIKKPDGTLVRMVFSISLWKTV